MCGNYYADGERENMKKFLIIGLGSMGKRRVRCLKVLGISQDNIYGMDKRADRCREAKEKYGIHIIKDENEIDFSEIKEQGIL